MTSATLDEARAAKDRAMELFGSLADVVAVGITRVGEGYGLKVNLRSRPGATASLPDDVDGVPVKFEIVGPLVKR